MFLRIKSGRLIFALVILWWAFSCAAVCCGQSPQPLSAPGPQQTPQALDTNTQQSGSVNGAITGTIVDPSGAVVPGATVMLTRDNLNPEPSTTSAPNTGTSKKGTLSGNDGRFVFAKITEVEVGLTQTEVAEEEIKIEEKQRVLGVFPNFYVSYIPNAAPLNSKQKFELAWKSVIDPVTFALVGVTAGVEQADNYFSGYGQGAQGYAKRFGAGYADTISGTFIGGAILPSLLKQDPRYFYKGTGSKRSRALYAIANAFICKGDNKQWQPNYSGILGSLAAGGISNLYYPASDRNGAALTFENAAIGIGGTAISNLLQEFVIRKLTPKVPNDPANPK